MRDVTPDFLFEDLQIRRCWEQNQFASKSTYGYQSGKFNQLTSTDTATMRYDPNGNMVGKSEGFNLWRYTWDYENRMVEASTRKQKVRYKYDALGRRVRRYTPGVREDTKFTNDGLDALIDDDDSTATLFDRQYTFNTANQIETITDNSGTRMFGYDLVGRLKTVSVSDLAELSLAGFGRLPRLGWRRRLVGRIWR